jgi:Ca-activated chloride channel family protein
MRRSFFFIPLLLLLAVIPVAAQDFCRVDPCLVAPCPTTCPPPRQPGVFTDPKWLNIKYHKVDISVKNQIATTSVDMEFVNEGNALAEGTFIFPLPSGAAVDKLVMYINGQPIQAKILEAKEARGVYDQIVRQYRDPALLEYVGQNAVQANVFPIPPGESRRIQISYSQVVTVDNGLIHLSYPLKVTNLVSKRPVQQMSIRVSVEGQDAISNIYSPSQPVAVQRGDDGKSFVAGYETNGWLPDNDFSLYYGISSETVNVNLLTYRESASEDGFFLLMVQPPVKLPQEQIIPKDVIIVLDQSGSMFGEKWDQARAAAEYVLKNLNQDDRFNVILFSTGWREFSQQMEKTEQAQSAIDWIRGQEAIGGTDINGALTTALDMVGERPTTILFLTDGLATEGTTDTPAILSNVNATAKPNVRIFTFGVGDDVDTTLLDSIVRDQHGASSYVRPTQRIDEEVASLYNKISAPVLTDVTLDMGGVQTQDQYPARLPDLFAGTQLTLVGRYRGDADNVTITLKGKVGGKEQTFTYNKLAFPPRAGGEPFIARLWATRRIGDLLNTIRLNGENKELVDSVVRLSVRYGIITPYTSFLIDEQDILTQSGREEAAASFGQQAQDLNKANTGSAAVDAAVAGGALANAEAPVAPMAMPTQTAGAPGQPPAVNEPTSADGRVTSPVQSVKDKTFLLQNGVWTDTTFQPDTMQTQKVAFLSDAYFKLLEDKPELAPYFAVGERVIVVLDGTAYEVTAEAAK